jgi:5-methylcytosine-specific restriction endonuclease McrA
VALPRVLLLALSRAVRDRPPLGLEVGASRNVKIRLARRPSDIARYGSGRRAAAPAGKTTPAEQGSRSRRPLMPGRILRGCASCGAPFEPRHARHRWCPNCEPGPESRSPTTRTRPSSSTERERIRGEVLPDGAECSLQLDGCEGLATVAHHVVDAADGGRFEAANLQPACDHCNSVLGGRSSSALRHGLDDRNSGTRRVGGPRPAPVGPTRLA